VRPGSGDNFIPREPSWTFSLQLVKSSIQLLSLRARQGQGFRILAQALPKSVEELKLFVTAQICNVESGCFPHGGSIPQRDGVSPTLASSDLVETAIFPNLLTQTPPRSGVAVVEEDGNPPSRPLQPTPSS
jgi:hypothetical protein